MAQGIYKSGEQINLVYQAINCLSGAIPVGTVFDEGGVVDAAKSTSLTSQLLLGEKTGVAGGRYHGHFIPDAEGRWTIVIQDKNGDGEVSKVYSVVGHNVDSIGDAVAALDTANVASQLLLTKSAIISSVLADLGTVIPSQLLLTKSSLVSAVLVDVAAANSDVKSAVLAQASDVKSAVANVSANAAAMVS